MNTDEHRLVADDKRPRAAFDPYLCASVFISGFVFSRIKAQLNGDA
jgi:hypothetical protein